MKDIFAKKDKRTELEKRFEEALEYLDTMVIGTKEYDAALSEVERLYELVKSEKEQTIKMHINPDTVMGVGGSILQILLILKHERLHNITSKAINFVRRR